MNKNTPIDIVYLWVDGADENWYAEKQKYMSQTNTHDRILKTNNGTACYRDNGELMHSLRSVEKHVPWVRNIYIITGFNQVPKWLNIKHPRIFVVPHQAIFPPNTLPTFNSTSIEMCIANIPGLAEHFLILNDDTFFNKPLSPRYFFDRRGRAIVRYSRARRHNKNIGMRMATADTYAQTQMLSAKHIENMFGKKLYKYWPSHGIDPYIKSSMQECRNHPLVRRDIEYTISQKFRTNTQIQRLIFNLYDLVTNRAVFVHSRACKCTRHKFMDWIYNTMHWRAIRKSPVVFTDCVVARRALKRAPIFCINDAPDSDEHTLQNNAAFMHELFPNKSEFEK